MDDTPNKMLERLVVALGGTKKVAPLLWGADKGVDEARRLLCDCLNDDRPAKLDFSQVLLILRMARQKGIHFGIEYVSESLGYSVPTPIEPQDEAAELQKKFIESVAALNELAAKIQSVNAPASVRASVRAVA